MDNTEQLKPEAMGNLDIPISKSKTLKWQQKTWSTWGVPRSSRDFDKDLKHLGCTKELKRFYKDLKHLGCTKELRKIWQKIKTIFEKIG